MSNSQLLKFSTTNGSIFFFFFFFIYIFVHFLCNVYTNESEPLILECIKFAVAFDVAGKIVISSISKPVPRFDNTNNATVNLAIDF